MYSASGDNGAMLQAVYALINKAIPMHQSLKEEDFKYYVEDLQTEIITHFNYHLLQEVPVFIDILIDITREWAKTDDKKKRYAAAVCLATLVDLFPFDDNIPLLEPVVHMLLRPGFKRLVVAGAKAVGYIGSITGPNRNHLAKVLTEQNTQVLIAHNTRSENLFAAAVVLNELAIAAPEHIFDLGTKTFVRVVSGALYAGDPNVRDLCVSMVDALFKSYAAPVGVFFLTDLLEKLRSLTTDKLVSDTNTEHIISSFKLLQILIRQRPYMEADHVMRILFPQCAKYVASANFDVMRYAMETIMFLHSNSIFETEPVIVRKMVRSLYELCLKNHKGIEVLFSKVIHTYPYYICKELNMFLSWFTSIMATLTKKDGPSLVFKLIVSTIDVVENREHLKRLFDHVINVMQVSTVPTPIHMLLRSLNQHHPNWHKELHNYKQFLVRLIHEEMGEPCQRWEAVVISLNAIDQLRDISYPDAVMLHSLVIRLCDSHDWQVRERVASSALHLFENHIDKMPLETMEKLVELAVDDPVRSVRKKSLHAFKPNVYKYLAQPEIIWKFASLIYDESYGVRAHAIEILGKLIPKTSASILRELLLTTLRQLPDRYNPIIPPRISDIFPQLISASEPIIHLYADAIFQRFMKMLRERFNNATTYKDPSLIYMNSAQLRDIDCSLITSLSHLNELCPDRVDSGPVIDVLSTVLSQPVHPWTKKDALKTLRAIAQIENDISFIWRNHPNLVESVLKIIREDASQKLVTLSMKLLGSLSACSMPPVLPRSPNKAIFIFRSFLSGCDELKRYFLKRYFKDLLDTFVEPMIDPKRETISEVLTGLFHADPESIPLYLPSFLRVFLPMFGNTTEKTLCKFFNQLTALIKDAGRFITPHATTIFQAIESHWRGHLTVEGSNVICALIESTHGQCDSILHLVVPTCFQLIKFKKKGASDIFKLLRCAAENTPTYLTTIIEGISELSQTSETSDTILGFCMKTLYFIVNRCDFQEHNATIKRCLIKVTNSSSKLKDRASLIVEEMNRRAQDDDATEVDEDYERRRTPTVCPDVDINELVRILKLPEDPNDETIASWYRELEIRLLELAPSPVVRALQPLSHFPGLLPSYSFIFAFLSVWQNLSVQEKDETKDLLNSVYKCECIPTAIATQFTNLAEFSVLSEIDIRLDFTALIPFCEHHKFFTKALFFLDYMPSTFPFTKLIRLNSLCQRKEEARSLARHHAADIDHSLWIELGDWDSALGCIRKSLDPTRFLSPQVICKAAVEDWEGIMQLRDIFGDLPLDDKVSLSRFFMMAAVHTGDHETAQEFFKTTNGFTTDDQIMRAQMLIRCDDLDGAHQAVKLGWRYLSSSVSSVAKCNKNFIQDHAFQAQELLELDEVIDCLRHPENVAETNAVWRGRLEMIESLPDRQKELFKIRSLVPDLPHFDAHMLNTISYYIWLGQRDVASRLAAVFFPDKNTPHAKYVQYELSGREESIEQMLELAQTCQNAELSSRLFQLVGNIRIKNAHTYAEFADVAGHYNAAAKSNEKIGNINILLAHSGGDFKAAARGVEALGAAVAAKPVKGRLFANQLLAALVNFGNDAAVAAAVRSAVAKVGAEDIVRCFPTAFGLLLHKLSPVNAVAAHVCERLVTEFPQHVGFQLLWMEGRHSDCEALEDLYDRLQMDHPVVFSHVSLLHKELHKIGASMYRSFQDVLKFAYDAATAGNSSAAAAALAKFARMLEDPAKSVHDRQFFSDEKMEILRVIGEITGASGLSLASASKSLVSSSSAFSLSGLSNTPDAQNAPNSGTSAKSAHQIEPEDLQPLFDVQERLQRKNQSLRVIRLGSVSPRLEKEADWDLQLPGTQSLIPNGVRISKFFHSLGNHESGIALTILGRDGKRYSYVLRRGLRHKRPLAALQFVSMLAPIFEDVHRVNHGAVIQLDDDLHLLEIPKGQTSVYEMITTYRQSKGSVTDAEVRRISAEVGFAYSELGDVSSRAEVLKMLSREFESNELHHALLVTSSDAAAWAYRTSHFAHSLGAMSAVAFFVGTVSHIPRDLLVDKVTGSVTFRSFAEEPPNQAVPFRFTPQIKNALGRYQYTGPFRAAFVATMKAIRKRAVNIAPVLQFTCCDPPHNQPVIPLMFLRRIGAEEPSEPKMGEIDSLYERLEGKELKLEDELEELIAAATNIENLAKMPAEWAAWW